MQSFIVGLIRGFEKSDPAKLNSKKSVSGSLRKLFCWTHLSSERRELGKAKLLLLAKLTFPDHMCDFNPGKSMGLQKAGISHLRLLPQRVDMVAVAAIFDDRRQARIDGPEAETHLGEISAGTQLSNGFFQGEAGYRRIASATANLP